MFKYLVIAIVLIGAFVLVRRLLARRPIEPVGKQPPKVITIDGDAVEVEAEGLETNIDPAVLDEIRRLNEKGQKIEAIKVLREATGPRSRGSQADRGIAGPTQEVAARGIDAANPSRTHSLTNQRKRTSATR